MLLKIEIYLQDLSVPLDFVFFGNNTFIGFTCCEILAKSGLNVLHLYVPRQKKRCRLKEYYQSNEYPSWAFELDSFNIAQAALIKSLEFLESNTNIICTGEIESYLLCNWHIYHQWISDGSDLTENLFQMTDKSQKMRRVIQGSKYILRILGSQYDMKHSARLLGLQSKHDE